MLALVFAAVLSAAPTQSAPIVQGPKEVSPVTVTARSPQAALRALEDCIKRGCSPAEEMRLTLQSAEASFLAGDYDQARATLDRAIRRNKRHGDAHPVLLAGVYKADNTVNRHLGRGDEAYKSMRQASLLLEKRYGEDSAAALWARLDSADALLNGARRNEARARYQELEREARAAGQTSLAGVLVLRQAWLPALQGRKDIAHERLQKVIDEAGPQRGLALAAGMLQVKLLPQGQQDAAAARVISSFRGLKSGPEPLLLWAPLLDQEQERLLLQALAAAGMGQPHIPDPSDWVDVGYFIEPSGRVRGAEVLRSGRSGASWHKTALEMFNRRIYAPPEGAEEASYHVERLAWTALVNKGATGTRMATRSLINQMHATDLTRAVQPTPPTP